MEQVNLVNLKEILEAYKLWDVAKKMGVKVPKMYVFINLVN